MFADYFFFKYLPSHLDIMLDKCLNTLYSHYWGLNYHLIINRLLLSSSEAVGAFYNK